MQRKTNIIIKNTISIFLICCFLFLSLYDNTNATSISQDELPWDMWKLTVEQQMLNSYKLHAAEQNVNNLQSTKVQNITEVIQEYPSSTYANYDNLNQAWDKLKDNFLDWWKEYNQSFRDATGYSGDDASGNAYCNIYSYPNGNVTDGNIIGEAIADWKNWDNHPKGNELEKAVNDCISELDIKNKVKEEIKNEAARQYNAMIGQYYTVNLDSNNNYKTTSLRNDYEQKIKNNFTTLRIDNYNTFILNTSSCTINARNAIQFQYVQGTIDSINRTAQVQVISFDRNKVTISNIESLGLTRNEAIAMNNSIYEQVIIKALETSNSTDPNSPFKKLRVKLTKILLAEYQAVYANAFWNGRSETTGVKGVRNQIEKVLNNTLKKTAEVQYCNFRYSGTIDGCWFRQRSALYFPYKGNESELMGLYYDKRVDYIKMEPNEIETMKNELCFPLYCELTFDPNNSPKYISWLTSSIIVKNELHHYEYWAQNLSNENDPIYYKEPIQINLSNEKDPNLTSDELKLQPSKHWGTILFTRYKYVDYTYYMYYPLLDNNGNSCMIVKVAENYPAWNKTKGYVKGSSVSNQAIGLHDNLIPEQKFIWIHAWTNKNAGGQLGTDYWIKDGEIELAVSVVKDHLAAEKPVTLGGGPVGIIWGGENNYSSSWWNHNGIPNSTPLRIINDIKGYGDYYRYDQPIRAEVTYYRVMLPNNAGSKDYELCLGENAPCKQNNGCFESGVLCSCEDEWGGEEGCELMNTDFEISSTLTH